MRAFLPLVASEICGELPIRELVVPNDASTADEREWAEYEAATRASLISLELAREMDEAVARRVVVALEIDGAPDWSHVQAILVDGQEAEPYARAACEAETDEEADAALDDLLEYPLEWFDILEREDLCHALNSGNNPIFIATT